MAVQALFGLKRLVEAMHVTMGKHWSPIEPVYESDVALVQYIVSSGVVKDPRPQSLDRPEGGYWAVDPTVHFLPTLFSQSQRRPVWVDCE